MNELIFGKDQTMRVVSVEPGKGSTCTLFIQQDDGTIQKKEVPLSHWLIYTEHHSDKMKRLSGGQPYKWLMEYDNLARYEEVKKASYTNRFDFFQARDPKEAFMLKEGVTYYKGMKPKDIAILSFDLEHTYGIGDTLNKDGQLLIISTTFRDTFGQIKKRLFRYDEFPSEAVMLDEWTCYVRVLDPSIIVGHNLFGHDFNILKHVSKKTKTPLSLGRDQSIVRFDQRKSFKRKDGSQSYEFHNAHIYGREIVDTFFLAINYDIGRNYESYGLKAIIKHEGLEKTNRQHYDASLISKNHKNPDEWQKIVTYAEDDADDALSLFDLMIAGYFYLTQSIPKSLQHINNSATGSWINSFMVRSYLQFNHSIAKATPLEDKTEGGVSFAIPGIYKNMLKVDLKSAYPSQVLRFNLYDKEKDPRANFYEMVKYFTEERFELKRLYKETRNEYYKDRDTSAKVFINSAYGVTITNKLNYNSPKLGKKITEETRNMIDLALIWASGEGRYTWMQRFKKSVGDFCEQSDDQLHDEHAS